MMDHTNNYQDVSPIIFDVDGVLCNTGCTITPDFQEYFLNWMRGKPVMLVTGSEHHRTREQLGDAIVDEALITYNCLGNSIWFDGKEQLHINPIRLKRQERLWIHHELMLMQFPGKLGNHMEQRRGSINISFTGRPATPEVRAAFKAWDEHHQYRTRLVTRFNEQNPRLEAFIGGETSVDICLRHANKAQIVNLLPQGMKRNHFIFFGDKCFPGGVDHPLAEYGKNTWGSTIHEVQGYLDTWKILQEVYS